MSVPAWYRNPNTLCKSKCSAIEGKKEECWLKSWPWYFQFLGFYSFKCLQLSRSSIFFGYQLIPEMEASLVLCLEKQFWWCKLYYRSICVQRGQMWLLRIKHQSGVVHITGSVPTFCLVCMAALLMGTNNGLNDEYHNHASQHVYYISLACIHYSDQSLSHGPISKHYSKNDLVFAKPKTFLGHRWDYYILLGSKPMFQIMMFCFVTGVVSNHW